MPTAPILDLRLQERTAAEGFTQSELSLMDECMLKWNFRYNNLLTREGEFNWSHFVGGAWHMFQQLWRQSKGEFDLEHAIFPVIPKGTKMDSDFEKTHEYWTHVLPAYQLAYAKMYSEEAKHSWMIIEEELSAQHLGFTIRGKIDLASDKLRFIRDFKTTVSAWLTSPNGWHFKLQFMLYCWLMVKNNPDWLKKDFQFQLDVMQKPGLKETKADGSWAGHIRRVCADVQKERPEYYLTRQSSLVSRDALARFEDNVLTPKIQKLALIAENPDETLCLLTNPNTNACNSFGNQCEFFEVCEKGWDAGKFFFRNRPTKHEELAG